MSLIERTLIDWENVLTQNVLRALFHRAVPADGREFPQVEVDGSFQMGRFELLRKSDEGEVPDLSEVNLDVAQKELLLLGLFEQLNFEVLASSPMLDLCLGNLIVGLIEERNQRRLDRIQDGVELEEDLQRSRK